MAISLTDVSIDVANGVWDPVVAPNSGARLSSGFVFNGPFDFTDGLFPAGLTQSTESGATLTTNLGFARGAWPVSASGTGGVGIFSGVPANAQEIYIEFDARFPDGVVWGNKFMKFFGSDAGTGTANMTAGPNFADSQNFDRVSFGDGTTTSNDTQHLIRLDGTTSASDIGRGSATAQINTPVGKFTPSDWGTDWHHFRYYMKLNTGTTAENEVPDGAFYLEIDGILYCDAGGFFNRNFANSQYIGYVGFLGYIQDQIQTITQDIDNIVLLKGGFL